MPNNVPPQLFKRNEFGLVENIDYSFNPDGTVNWRKMIKPEFIAVNEQYFKRYGKTAPKSIEGLQDKELIILLGGIKELAQLRGCTDVIHTVSAPSENYVVSVCSIKFIGNYETGNVPVQYSAIGDASPMNTNGFGKLFLGAFAENRAFVRCVRNYLKVNIVSDIELSSNGGPSTPDESDITANILMDTMRAAGITFEKIKDTLIKDGFENAEAINSITDIPKTKQFELIERIKKSVSKKK